MKKKFAVFVLLLAVLTGVLAAPEQAKAQAEITESGLHFNRNTGMIYDDSGFSWSVSDDVKAAIAQGKHVMILANASGNVTVFVYESQYDIAFWESGNGFYHFVNNNELVLKDDYPYCYKEGYDYQPGSESSEAAVEMTLSYQQVTNMSTCVSSDYDKYAKQILYQHTWVYHETDILKAEYKKDANGEKNYFFTLTRL